MIIYGHLGRFIYVLIWGVTGYHWRILSRRGIDSDLNFRKINLVAFVENGFQRARLEVCVGDHQAVATGKINLDRG